MRVLSLLLPAFIGLLAGGCDRDREQPAQPARRIKLGTILQDPHPTAQALHFFAKRVESLSGGRLDAQVFPSSQLGSADELVDGMRTGDIEMALVGNIRGDTTCRVVVPTISRTMDDFARQPPTSSP